MAKKRYLGTRIDIASLERASFTKALGGYPHSGVKSASNRHKYRYDNSNIPISVLNQLAKRYKKARKNKNKPLIKVNTGTMEGKPSPNIRSNIIKKLATDILGDKITNKTTLEEIKISLCSQAKIPLLSNRDIFQSIPQEQRKIFINKFED